MIGELAILLTAMLGGFSIGLWFDQAITELCASGIVERHGRTFEVSEHGESLIEGLR